MKDKQFDPAENNEKSPAEGMAAVNTHNPGEESTKELIEQKTGNETPAQQNNETKTDRS